MKKKLSPTQQWMADHPDDVPCPRSNANAWRRKRGLDAAGSAIRAKYEAAMAEKREREAAQQERGK
jgi:hypothetical protein